jgi:hypothetical protein
MHTLDHLSVVKLTCFSFEMLLWHNNRKKLAVPVLSGMYLGQWYTHYKILHILNT